MAETRGLRSPFTSLGGSQSLDVRQSIPIHRLMLKRVDRVGLTFVILAKRTGSTLVMTNKHDPLVSAEIAVTEAEERLATALAFGSVTEIENAKNEYRHAVKYRQ